MRSKSQHDIRAYCLSGRSANVLHIARPCYVLSFFPMGPKWSTGSPPWLVEIEAAITLFAAISKSVLLTNQSVSDVLGLQVMPDPALINALAPSFSTQTSSFGILMLQAPWTPT